MRILQLSAFICLLASRLAAAPDTVDTGFAASAGRVYSPGDYGGVASILVQPDGKIIVGSNEMEATVNGNPLAMPLVRFLPDGTVDHTFFADNDPDGKGSGIFFDSPGWSEVHALGLLSDGKIVAAGVMEGVRTGTSAADPGIFLRSNSIVRFNGDGTIDTTFQTAGTTSWPTGGLNYIEDVTVQPDDKTIIVGGFGGVRDSWSVPGVIRYGIARLNVNGSLDTGFHLNPVEFGVPANAYLPRGWFRQAALDSAGRILLAGQFEWGPSYPTAGTALVLARLHPDGSRDTSFLPVVPSSVTGYQGVVVEPDGKIMVLASTATGSWMGRFLPDGSPDPSFQLDAALTGPVSSRPLQADAEGRYLLATRAPGSSMNNRLVRISGDGSLDPTFNATASYTGSPSGETTGYFGTFTTSPSGKIYSGSFFSHVNGVESVKVVAFEGNATPDGRGIIQLAAPAFSASEQDGVLRVAVTRSGGVSGAASATLSLGHVTTSAADLSLPTTTVNFADGAGGTVFIELPVTADSLAEANETATLTLGGITGATAGTRTSATLTILDSDSPPLVTRQPQTLFVPPGNPFTLNVGVSSGNLPLTYQWYKDGSPISGATAPVYAVASADAASHNGSYTVTIHNPAGPVTSSAAVVTVKNPAVLGFSAATASVVESDGTLTLTLTRSGSNVGAVSVDVSLEDGTALSPADYANATTTINWADGDSSDKTVSISIVNDSEVESPESFRAVLANPSLDVTLGAIKTVNLTILDDDSGPAITRPLASRRVVLGWNDSLSVEVQSQTAVSYQWFKDGVLIPGETSATLSFEPVELEDFGYYEVHATNSAGTVVSGPVELGERPNPLDRIPLDLSVSYNQFSGVKARPGGGYLIYGAFTSVPTSGGTVNQPRIIRTNPDGTLDTTFNPGPNSTVSNAIELPDGSIVLYGGFTQIGVVSVPGGIAKILPNGSVDPDFLTNLPAGFGAFRDLKLGPDGKIYLTHANGVDRLNLDGTSDPSFRANVAANFEATGNTYNNIEFGPGGEIYLAGRYDIADGVPGLNFRNLLKLNANGSIDPTWKFIYGSSTFSYVGIQADGKIIVPASGSSLIRLHPDGTQDTSFTTILGVQNMTFGVALDGSVYIASGSSSNTKLRHFLPNGSPDTIFNNGADVAMNNSISAITPLADGSISIHGSFTTVDGVSVARPYLITALRRGISITAQPVPLTVNPGETATFTVVASSVSPLTYQWRKNGVDLPGATFPSLVIGNPQAADTGIYSVTVSSPDSSVTSAVALLTVRDQPVILAIPQDMTGLVGAPLELSVDWVGLEPATFQWYRNGTLVSGQTTATLSISSPGETDSGIYTLVITNSLGSVTTEPVAVNVIKSPGGLASGFVPPHTRTNANPPSIQKILPEPGGAYLFNSSPYSSLLVHTSGTYDQFIERVESDGDISPSFGATINSNTTNIARDPLTGDLLFSGNNFLLNGTGSRRIARTAADGTEDTAYSAAAQSVMISQNMTPFAIAFEASGKVLAGAYGKLVRLAADGTLESNFSTSVTSFQIQRIYPMPDGRILLFSGSGLRMLLGNGSLDSSFTMPAFPEMNYAGMDVFPSGDILLAHGIYNNQQFIYRLSPTGELLQSIGFSGSTYGTLFGLFALPDGKFLVSHNSGSRLSCLNADGSLDNAFAIGTGFNSTVNTAAQADDGSIWIGGGFTQFNGSAAFGVVRLNGFPRDLSIQSHPLALTADEGDTAAFSVDAVASGGGSISYVWRRNGAKLENGGRISGADTATLSIANAQDSDEGEYDVILVHSATGRPLVSKTATLTVLNTPEILAQSGAQNLEVGQPLALTVEAVGAGTIGYQWLRNGTEIFGANSPAYQIAHVVGADSAVYSVRVTNAHGVVTSDPMPVNVILPAGGIAFGTGNISFGSAVSCVLPLPDGRTLVGGNFTTVTVGSTNHAIKYIALLDETGSLVTSFNLNPGNLITSMALTPDGGVLVSGSFTTIGGQSRARLAKLTPALEVDTSWNPGTGPSSGVMTILADDSGYYLGGSFSSYAGNTSAPNLCRIHADGTFDASFTPPSLGAIYRIRKDNDGVVAGGNFTITNTVASRTQYGIIRLNADGSFDTSFATGMNGSTTVYDIIRLQDGRWLACGSGGKIARFHANGSPDNTWNTTTNSSNVRALAQQRDGRILIGGNFTTIGGQSINRLARVHPNGAIDPTFTQGAGADGEVVAVELDALGGIHIGGSFNTYRGEARGRYARLNGSPLSIGISRQPVAAVVNPGSTATFSVSVLATDSVVYQWRKNGVPLADGGDISGAKTATLTLANAEDADEDFYDVVVTHLGNADEVVSDTAELIVLGAPEILFQPKPVTTEVGLGAVFRVTARGVAPLAFQWYLDGVALADGPGVSGAETKELVLSGLALEDSGTVIVRVTNALGYEDSDPVSLLVEKLPAGRDYSVVLPASVSSTINDVIPFSGGGYLIGGNFTSLTGTNGAKSMRYLAKVNADGSVDTTVPYVSGSGSVDILARDANGKIYVGGSFTTLVTTGGNVTRNRFARLNADLTLDTGFVVEGTGPNGAVKAILPLADGSVLIGGQFSSVNGKPGTSYIALLDSAGNVSTSFTSLASNTVSDIAPAGDGTYWLSHGNSYGGQSRIVRITATGAIASGFSYTGTVSSTNVSPQADGSVLSLSSYALQKITASGEIVNNWGGAGIYMSLSNPSAIATSPEGIYIGGGFTTPRARIAALDPDGALIADFDPKDGPNGSPTRIRVDDSGRVWVVGNFSAYQGVSVPNLVVLNGLRSDSPADPYDQFVADLPEGQQGETDDPDGDGMPNLVEFAFGTDPAVSNPLPALTSTVVAGSSLTGVPDPTKQYRVVTVEVPKDTQGASVSLEASADLSFTGGATATEILPRVDNGTTETRSYYLTPAMDDTDKLFWRLKVER